MEFKIITDWTVEDLTRSWLAGEMRSNPEYQRGAKWSLPQRQSLIDSVFRLYSSVYEIVDGQQRIVSLSNFVRGFFETPDANDQKLRWPNSLRTGPAPWGGQKFSRLTEELQQAFEKTRLTVVLNTDGSRRRSSRSIY